MERDPYVENTRLLVRRSILRENQAFENYSQEGFLIISFSIDLPTSIFVFSFFRFAPRMSFHCPPQPPVWEGRVEGGRVKSKLRTSGPFIFSGLLSPAGYVTIGTKHFVVASKQYIGLLSDSSGEEW